MTDLLRIRVPDIGDFDAVEVVEVLVKPGDRVDAEQSLITLESDKASLEIPSPAAGTLRELRVALGSRVSEGDLIATLAPDEAEVQSGSEAASEPVSAPTPTPETSPAPPQPAPAEVAPAGPQPAAAPATADLPEADETAELVVIGSGPGGYTAAFRAADLGVDVILIERFSTLGGVCLNVGCIPSKAMLHAAAVLDEVEEFADRGIRFGKPEIDLVQLAGWKDGVVTRLTKGLAQLASKRQVRVLQGTATLTGAHTLELETETGTRSVAFSHAIVATGSRPVMLPDLPDDPRIMTSNEAIRFDSVPRRLLVVGGGIIGLEMAQVYSSLGSEVTVVELLDGLMPGADRDLLRPLERRLRRRYRAIHTSTRVTGIVAQKRGLKVAMEGPGAPESATFDAVLVAVGRRPNSDRIGADAAGLELDERGFLPVDSTQRTNVPHILAIGDVCGQPMLAHKATHEAKVAAEVVAGLPAEMDARVIPSVAYTDPEVAWVGVTEEEAEERGLDVEKGAIPWVASGRALGIGRADGLTKLLFDTASGRLIGAGIVGPGAGDLISETALAIEMGADASDLALTVHPHPTLSETVAFAAEAVEGTVTDLYLPRK